MADSPAVSPQRTAELNSVGVPEKYHPYFDRLSLGGLTAKLGIHFVELSPEYSIATMPVEGNTQLMGLLHGGASAALAETIGSIAAYLSVAHEGKGAMGVDLNVTHLRPASGGLVTAVCRAVKLGKTVCVHTVDITDQNGKQVCAARITNNIIPLPH